MKKLSTDPRHAHLGYLAALTLVSEAIDREYKRINSIRDNWPTDSLALRNEVEEARKAIGELGLQWCELKKLCDDAFAAVFDCACEYGVFFDLRHKDSKESN